MRSKRVMTPQKAIEQWSSHIVCEDQFMKWRCKSTVSRFFDEITDVWYATDEQRNEFERLLYTGIWEELLRYIWAFYNRVDWWKYCRLASWLLSKCLY